MEVVMKKSARVMLQDSLAKDSLAKDFSLGTLLSDRKKNVTPFFSKHHFAFLFGT